MDEFSQELAMSAVFELQKLNKYLERLTVTIESMDKTLDGSLGTIHNDLDCIAKLGMERKFGNWRIPGVLPG